MLRVLTVSSAFVVLIVLAPGTGPSSADDDAAVRAVLEAYLSSVSFPDPEPIDAKLFAADIEAFWSNGKTYRGREAVLKAHQQGVDELKADFESFAAKVVDPTFHRKGELAWLTCRIQFEGKLAEERGDFRRAIRSTFVFEKRDGRWQMVHEHSSRLPEGSD